MLKQTYTNRIFVYLRFLHHPCIQTAVPFIFIFLFLSNVCLYSAYTYWTNVYILWLFSSQVLWHMAEYMNVELCQSNLKLISLYVRNGSSNYKPVYYNFFFKLLRSIFSIFVIPGCSWLTTWRCACVVSSMFPVECMTSSSTVEHYRLSASLICLSHMDTCVSDAIHILDNGFTLFHWSASGSCVPKRCSNTPAKRREED